MKTDKPMLRRASTA